MIPKLIVTETPEKKSQTLQVYEYIGKHGSITPLEALEHIGCFRLGARIWELKDMGFPVTGTMVTENGKRFKRYYMKSRSESANPERQEAEGLDSLPSENTTKL